MSESIGCGVCHPKQPVAERRLRQEEAFHFSFVHWGLCKRGKQLQVDGLAGRDVCFGDNLRAGMKISLKERVTFRLCYPYIRQSFNFLCQKGYLLISKYLIDFSPPLGAERAKVNLDVVCQIDQISLGSVWGEVIQGEAKSRPFELFASPHELCVSRSVLENFENDRSAGEQLHTHVDQGVACAVDEESFIRGAGNHR